MPFSKSVSELFFLKWTNWWDGRTYTVSTHTLGISGQKQIAKPPYLTKLYMLLYYSIIIIYKVCVLWKLLSNTKK